MDAEKIVKDFLSKYGLESEKFSKEEMRNGKTPDYRSYKDGKLFCYCEVKNAQKDMWLDEKLENSEPFEIVGGLRNDPTFNRLSAHIHKSRKQFDSVNCEEKIPNILVFYNEDERSGFLDLMGVVTGNFYTEGGQVIPAYKNISEGRVKNDIEKIHLIIWLDAHKPYGFLFNTINSKFKSELCSVFGVDPAGLELIPS